MGAADVVPGVSGGTIAFISGIYEELIETIHGLDLGFFKTWKSNGFKSAWKQYNLSFLTALFGGVLISILSLAKAISWLLENHPIAVWSFFFGLILASIVYVGRDISKWNAAVVSAVLLGALISYFITVMEPVGSPDSTWFLFLAGFVAIIAMILPGISGAFILLLIGAYTSVIGTVNDFTAAIGAGDTQALSDSGLKLVVFALGAVLGLKIFSRGLNWMFKNYKDTTLALLTGFMIGALNKIWPWKQVISYRTNSHGEEVPFQELSVWPSDFSGDPKVGLALVMALIGFTILFAIEKLASTRKKPE